jgi:hypothetical protein
MMVPIMMTIAWVVLMIIMMPPPLQVRLHTACSRQEYSFHRNRVTRASLEEHFDMWACRRVKVKTHVPRLFGNM